MKSLRMRSSGLRSGVLLIRVYSVLWIKTRTPEHLCDDHSDWRNIYRVGPGTSLSSLQTSELRSNRNRPKWRSFDTSLDHDGGATCREQLRSWSVNAVSGSSMLTMAERYS